MATIITITITICAIIMSIDIQIIIDIRIMCVFVVCLVSQPQSIQHVGRALDILTKEDRALDILTKADDKACHCGAVATKTE